MSKTTIFIIGFGVTGLFLKNLYDKAQLDGEIYPIRYKRFSDESFIEYIKRISVDMMQK